MKVPPKYREAFAAPFLKSNRAVAQAGCGPDRAVTVEVKYR
jgi:hypothetical protein